MRRVSRFLTTAVIALIVLGIAGCGNTSSSAQNSSTPAAQHSNSPTPGSATPNPTPAGTRTSASQIVFTFDKRAYTTHDRIQVTITNHLSTAIFVSPYYTNCTAVRLELNRQNTWLPQGRCPSSTPHSVALQPGASLVQQLTPTAPTPQIAVHAAWQTGTYRLALFYTLAPDEDVTQGQVFTSSAFIIY